MKSLLICSTTFLAAASLLAADKDDASAAAQKLAAADNYSWTITVEGGQNNAGPSHGKIQKDGLIWMEMAGRTASTEAFVKGGKGAVKTDDGWEAVDLTATRPAGGGGGGGAGGGGGGNNTARFAGRLRNLKAPAVEAADIIGKTKDLTKADDVYTGDLTEDGAKSLLTMGRGRRGGQAPAVSDAKGSAKFWVKDGVLTKYQFKVSGTTKNRNGDDVDIDRTTTVEIKDVGTTTLTLPDEAKGKLG
jgi:hypothetical protein